MKFDCLCPKSPLFGPHLLEASAGTGKTFAIEHVFVRLILEGVFIDEILAVTFTRAIARELKERIRSNLEKALTSLKKGDAIWPYLESYIGSELALFNLNQALMGFDEAQIYTIHGFCFRILSEYAFETGSFSFKKDPDHPFEVTKKMKRSLNQFFTSGVTRISKEQLSLLFSSYNTIKEIGLAILKGKEPEKIPLSFDEAKKEFLEKISSWDLSNLHLEFEEIAGNYKAKKGDFLDQIEALQKMDLGKLILHKGTLFSFLSSENKKLRPKTAKISPFFEWAEKEIAPLVFDASNRKKILESLIASWKDWEKNSDSPDEILKEMQRAIKIPTFLDQLRKKYKAVIIDEFQDTDPLQWEIFYHTFLKDDYLKALYLVGDPKQSIYRFRNADVYTYYEAKRLLGAQNIYKLDTNYRSSKELVGALNTLFDRNFLKLPKIKETIPFEPVHVGSEITSNLGDEKKAVHFLVGKGPFYSYVALEIEKLGIPFGSIAVLVKDRFEAKNVLSALSHRGIPCVSRSHEPLGKTKDFRFLREFLDAVLNPHDENLKCLASKGPFKQKKSFLDLNELIQDKGPAHFFRVVFEGTVISHDLKAILEEIFLWEEREGFSISGFKSFLREFEFLSAEEGAFKKMDESKDAVQVLTLHVSKGLEFDVVFALALGSKSPPSEEEPEEYNAEKLRQLYVAMTRAKKRLYVPFVENASSKKCSPIDLFFEEDGLSFIKKLSETHDISYEEVKEIPLQAVEKEERVCKKERESFFYTPSLIQSFTSLKKGKEILFIEATDQSLPRGKETGTVIHGIFEAIFSSKDEIWKEDALLDRFIENKLVGTKLEAGTPYIQVMIQATLAQPLFDGSDVFSLKELSFSDVMPEMEFMYTKRENFISGSIDLVFFKKKRLYFIDWKTNTLRSPTLFGAEEVMKAYDYPVQAALYKEALSRYFEEPIDQFFGGAFYLFVRTGTYIHFIPEDL